MSGNVEKITEAWSDLKISVLLELVVIRLETCSAF